MPAKRGQSSVQKGLAGMERGQYRTATENGEHPKNRLIDGAMIRHQIPSMPRTASRVSSKPVPLPRAIRPRDHAPIATLDAACAYMLALPRDMAAWNCWGRAAGLAMAAREQPSAAALEEFARQFELALFLTWRADLTVDGD